MDIRLNGFTRSDDSLHYVVLIRDITDMREAQLKLQESEEHFRAFGQASSEAMLIHNTKGILSWNPRLSEMTGYSAREIARMDPLDFVHPMERDKVWEMHKDYDLARSYETLFTTKDGLELEVAVTGKPVEWKNEKARIKVIRDVTHLKDFEQILNISRERYRTLTDNTIDLVCSFNEHAEIKIANHTFWEYFGVPQGTQCHLIDFMPEEDRERVLAHVAQVSPDNPVSRTLHRVIRNGEIRWLDCIDRAVFNADGGLLEIQSVGRDVTDYINDRK
jgi:PAS domain S-box-containing protein